MMPGRPYSRLMSISREEFLRLLPKAIGQELTADQHANGQFVSATNITLSWRSLPPASFGVVELPQLQVSMVFDCDGDAMKEFLYKFDRIYQRGGG